MSVVAASALEVRKTDGSTGVEISGVDLSRELE